MTSPHEQLQEMAKAMNALANLQTQLELDKLNTTFVLKFQEQLRTHTITLDTVEELFQFLERNRWSIKHGQPPEYVAEQVQVREAFTQLLANILNSAGK